VPERESEPTFAVCDAALGYGGDPVLEGIDLEAQPGEIVALLGGSGSGKSTVLKAVAGLLPPTEGEVRLFDRDLYAAGTEERQRLVRRAGMLFQSGALFGAMSVLDNVTLPLRETTELPFDVMVEMARLRLARVGLSGYEHRSPGQLSGGEQKRVALARASILDPELMLCDEPTGGLDPRTAAALDETLLGLRDALGSAVVVVTHDLDSTRRIADRVVMLHDGGIRAVGTYDELEGSDDEVVVRFLHRDAPEGDDHVDRLEALERDE